MIQHTSSLITSHQHYNTSCVYGYQRYTSTSEISLYDSNNPKIPLTMAAINFASTACSAGNRGQLVDAVSQWQCCNCNCGWQLISTNPACPDCGTYRCEDCTYS
ncbi:hypothetical protein QWA68_002730 [Fusarium oxysporum]|nr:hypothetical protein QWA68_002730 [Fusarium oxysporum]